MTFPCRPITLKFPYKITRVIVRSPFLLRANRIPETDWGPERRLQCPLHFFILLVCEICDASSFATQNSRKTVLVGMLLDLSVFKLHKLDFHKRLNLWYAWLLSEAKLCLAHWRTLFIFRRLCIHSIVIG